MAPPDDVGATGRRQADYVAAPSVESGRSRVSSMLVRALLVALVVVPAWFLGGVEPQIVFWMFIATILGLLTWLVGTVSTANKRAA